MYFKIGFKIVAGMFALSEWLKEKAYSLNIRLSMRQYHKENGHL